MVLQQGHPMQLANVLEASLVNLEVPQILFICSYVLGALSSSRKFYVAFSSHLKPLATLMGLVASLRTWSSRI